MALLEQKQDWTPRTDLIDGSEIVFEAICEKADCRVRPSLETRIASAWKYRATCSLCNRRIRLLRVVIFHEHHAGGRESWGRTCWFPEPEVLVSTGGGQWDGKGDYAHAHAVCAHDRIVG